MQLGWDLHILKFAYELDSDVGFDADADDGASMQLEVLRPHADVGFDASGILKFVHDLYPDVGFDASGTLTS